MAGDPRQVTPRASVQTSKKTAAPAPVSVGGTLGALAIMVGLGALGAYMLDLHGHTCEQCGRRWRHLGAFNLGDENSHTCSRCGQVQWWKCGVPHVLRGSQFAASPMNFGAPSASTALAGSPVQGGLQAPVHSASDYDQPLVGAEQGYGQSMDASGYAQPSVEIAPDYDQRPVAHAPGYAHSMAPPAPGYDHSMAPLAVPAPRYAQGPASMAPSSSPRHLARVPPGRRLR